MSGPQLDKYLFNQITRLKLCNKPDAPVRFLVEKSPFPDDDDDPDAMRRAAAVHEYIISGLIFPKSEIFNQGAYRIEMKLTNTYPGTPPEVRFLTSIYHPNVGRDGKFCNELLQKTCSWKADKTLIDVVEAVTKHIDEPDIDYALSPELGLQYQNNRKEFNTKALEYVKNYSIPRK